MRFIKLVVIIFMFIGCTSAPHVIEGSTSNIQHVLDSINNVDGISAPSINKWPSVSYESNKGIYTQKYLVIEENKKLYIFTVDLIDSIYNYKYRIE